MLAATSFKEFKRILPAADKALATKFNRLPVELEGGAAPGWWTGSCFRFRPRSFNTSADRIPAGCGFFERSQGPVFSRVIVQWRLRMWHGLRVLVLKR